MFHNVFIQTATASKNFTNLLLFSPYSSSRCVCSSVSSRRILRVVLTGEGPVNGVHHLHTVELRCRERLPGRATTSCSPSLPRSCLCFHHRLFLWRSPGDVNQRWYNFFFPNGEDFGVCDFALQHSVFSFRFPFFVSCSLASLLSINIDDAVLFIAKCRR